MNQSSDQRQVALLDVIAFREWLAARKGQVVGSSASEESCPLARFLSEICALPYRVEWDSYSLATFACGPLPLPVWAQAFVRRLDFTYAGDDISGGQALKLLSQVVGASDGPGEQYCWLHQPGGWTCTVCRLNRRLFIQAEAIACYALEHGFSVAQGLRDRRFVIMNDMPDVSVEPSFSTYDVLLAMIEAFHGLCPFLTSADGVLVTRLL